MRSPNRDRRNNRSTALCAVILLTALLLLAVPAAANTADFRVSENGSVLFAEARFSGSSYLLVTPGILGEDVALETVNNLVLVSVDGTVVEPKNTKGTLTFPEGDYTLTYDVPISGGFIYAKFPEFYNVTVTLPEPYTTGHLILGTVSSGGVVAKEEGKTVVTFNQTKAASLTFYEDNREPILYAFLAGWLVVFALAYLRYRKIKKNRLKI
ncbi:MAG: hypothetical protein E7Z72_02490 [Methanocorpusculum parvum]|nr:hypothetical protein [Methanocorpusculum parvum]